MVSVFEKEHKLYSAHCSKTIEKGGQKSNFDLNQDVHIMGQSYPKSSMDLIFDTFRQTLTLFLRFLGQFFYSSRLFMHNWVKIG